MGERQTAAADDEQFEFEQFEQSSVTKADDKGKLLERMSRGTCVGYKSRNAACEAQNEFHQLAKLIPNRFAAYGVSCVVDERCSVEFLVAKRSLATRNSTEQAAGGRGGEG